MSLDQPPFTVAGDGLATALADLAYNLRWAWEPATADLFATIAPHTWRDTANPVLVMGALADDPAALGAHADRVLAARHSLASYLERPPTPEVAHCPRVAYLSAEFALTECLPIYSGGLGVLAGDHLKAASDLGLPLVGVGLLYRYGYFRQTLDEGGYQRECYDRLETDDLPVRPVLEPDGTPVEIAVPFPGRAVRARVWRAQVGRVPLYLLDSELEANREDDRWITGHLYGGDQDTRIRQEILLGVGGRRLLRRLQELSALPWGSGSDPPEVYHLNEGHSAFVALELAREEMEAGHAPDFHAAAVRVAPRVAFTTHTPVAAGHDAFPSELVEAYFAAYRPQLRLDHEELMSLGRRHPDARDEGFSMTVLALRSAQRRNAVSQLHGVVSRQMWGGIGVGGTESPPAAEMDAITNGVHTATWAGPHMAELFDAALGPAWRNAPHSPAAWQPLAWASPHHLWLARTAQRARLLRHLDAAARHSTGTGLAESATPEHTLVLGFARRFATYKRAALLLDDPDRLERLLAGDPRRPVVLVFAGKAHPRDDPGKLLMQRIVHASRDTRFRGRLLFLEDYSVALARLLVQGSDVWLNTPRRFEEASGTSGMKATLNGALHLSEMDGWWDEAYADGLGWALGRHVPDGTPTHERDVLEARHLADLLEGEVAPLFYDRDDQDLPREWLARVSRSIATLAPTYSAHRMVADYASRVYGPAGRGEAATEALLADHGALSGAAG